MGTMVALADEAKLLKCMGANNQLCRNDILETVGQLLTFQGEQSWKG